MAVDDEMKLRLIGDWKYKLKMEMILLVEYAKSVKHQTERI
ncbi:MAG: hypothetical protein WB392_06355 [Methanotrichaceae archaeon]